MTSSTSSTRTILFQSAAILAAVGCIAALALFHPFDSSLSPHEGRRLLLNLRGLSLPETIEARPPFVTSSGGTVESYHASPGQLIAANPYDLRKFPYYTADDDCITAQNVFDLAEMIKDLYHKHGIRIIPRNGFLLGIVRHGGFLPIEKIDVDISVVYEDLVGLVGDMPLNRPRWLGDERNPNEFKVNFHRTEDDWVNWKGREPGTDKEYEYFGVMFNRNGIRMEAKAMYRYRDTGGYFFPRLDRADFNHDVHLRDGLRWNQEGADLRLLDTDELMTEENYEDGKQLGNYFDTDLSCTQEVQFYFTTIYVPCDYDAILTSQYGNGWRNVEKRGPRGGPRNPTKKLSEEESQELLNGGPRPICRTHVEPPVREGRS